MASNDSDIIAYAREFIGKSIHELPTPCLTLDSALLGQNLQTLQSEVAHAGKALRAHAKSHKCTRLARRQIDHGAIGICAAKLSEAERLAAAGIPGILITGPIVTREAHQRLLRLLHQIQSDGAGADLIITLDSEENALAISSALRESAPDLPPLPFLLDLNIGQDRTGIPPRLAVGLAEKLARLPYLKMVGLQAYAGHLQHLPTRAERQEAHRTSIADALEIFDQLRSDDVRLLSVGGTGSCAFDLALPAVTEIQAGSYALMDADYLAIEPSTERSQAWPFHPSLKLRTTVLSTHQSTHQPGFVTVDAGLKAVYRDGPAPLVTGTSGEPSRHLTYDWFGDEYGRISGDERSLSRLKTGTALDLIVSHCDPTVNLFDFYYLIEGETVADVWPIDLRGCCF